MHHVVASLTWENASDWFLEHGWRIALIAAAATILVIFLNWIGPRLAHRAARGGSHGRDSDADAEQIALTIASVVAHTADVVVVIIATLMILAEAGLNVTPLVAGVGVGSVAFGLAAQGIVRDYLRGMVILSEQHYIVGDYVTLAGVTGIVEEVTLRRTLVRAADGTLHNISNGDIGVASRHTERSESTVLRVTIPYDADPARVTRIATTVIEEFRSDGAWQGALSHTPSIGAFEAFDELGATLPITLHARPDVRWVVVGELHRRIREALSDAGIELPRIERFATRPGD